MSKNDHPEPAELEKLFRGELPRERVAPIVRHFLRGCAPCCEVTRRLWKLGEAAPAGPGKEREEE